MIIMKIQRSRHFLIHAYLAFIKFDQIAFWRLEDFFWGGSRIYKGGGGGGARNDQRRPEYLGESGGRRLRKI